MRKLIFIFLTLFIFFNAFQLIAQQKYALLVGINKYYDKPGVPHQPLHGCVNDAMSIKNLLLQQFGFNEKNIHTILDEQATRESLLGGLKNILDNAKTGDAVVFYYSGHGAWLSNKSQSTFDTTLKHGQNQAMVMNNLYAHDLSCLVRDADLKIIANKFVDKGIVFTVIADCCFSGAIVLAASYAVRNSYHKVEPYFEHGLGRSIGFFNINDEDETSKKEKGDSLNGKDVRQTPDDKTGNDTAFRSFNLKDALIIHDSTFITRPSERPHSMFLSLSASFQYEPALEETDETNTRHGIFTKAIIDAIKNNSPEMPVAELMKKVNQTILTQQRYPQSPQHHEDPARLKKNLLGIAPAGFRRNTIVSVIGVAGNKITLRGGVWSNLAAGNVLSAMQSNSKIKLRITQAFTDSSEAEVINGEISSVKAGDKFMVTDNYAASAPLMKLFIGSKDFTPASFKNFMDKKIIPLTLRSNYMDYENWYSIQSYNINFSEAEDKAEKNAQKILRGEIRDSFVIMLPIPSYIAGPLKAAVQKNQNVVLVNSPAEADYVLYLNYVEINSIDVKHPHFVFTWNHLMNPEYNAKWGNLMFIDQNAKTKNAELLAGDINLVAPKIAVTPNMLIREHSGHWLNFLPKR